MIFPCPRCWLMPPNPDGSGAWRAGCCPCHPTQTAAIGAVREANRRHVQAVLRARMSDLTSKGWAA